MEKKSTSNEDISNLHIKTVLKAIDDNKFTYRLKSSHPKWKYVTELIHQTWLYDSQIGRDAKSLN